MRKVVLSKNGEYKYLDFKKLESLIEKITQIFYLWLFVELRRTYIADIELANELLKSYLKNPMTNSVNISILPNLFFLK